MEPNKNLLNLIEELQKKVTSLEDQVRELYRENLETTNTLYEISNSLESRIDILASEPYNLDKFSLDK
jgi:16S rRNA G527 N7-methylase RsmG